MTMEWLDVAGGDGLRVLAAPTEGLAGRPGVVVLQHAPGVDAFVEEVVRRLAGAGYAAAAPALYHRQPADDAPPLARMARLRDAEVLEDVARSAAWLRQRGAGPLGVTGFCMGGRIALLAATSLPDFAACGVFYGGGLRRAWGDGPAPLDRAAELDCPLMGLYGAEDEDPSPADVDALGAALAAAGKWHEFHVYRDAGHAFLNFLNPERHRPRAARAAWQELLAFFSERLGRDVVDRRTPFGPR